MKYLNKGLALLLAALMCVTAAAAGMTSVYADSFFDDGDYRFAVMSDNTLEVAKYFGQETALILPEYVGDRTVRGVHDGCFENSEIVSVSLPRNYTNIGAFAFSNCKNLTEVRLSSGLKSIGMMAFYGCEALSSADFETPENLESISVAAFSGCTSLVKAQLPDTVNKLGESAFFGCSSLNEIHIPSGLTAVSANAFGGCALSELTLPGGLESIGMNAFANNAQLGYVDLPLSLVIIGAGAFENDAALESVFVPDSVTEIGESAFAPMTDSADFEVRCFENTLAAEYFSQSETANLKVCAKVYGDLNLDGTLDVTDATAVQKHLAELDVYRLAVMLDIADANRDGNIDITDAIYIQMKVAGY